MSRRPPLSLLLGVVAAFASLCLSACAFEPTAPTTPVRTVPAAAQHDDTPPVCRSGYVIINGVAQCNP